ncbi:MAG: aspartate aminotransferase family protein [Candidatus Poribacteria bacterium]
MPKTESEKWTDRLQNIMPWGSSTCSKAPRFSPEEPGVIVKGKGCRVWDADGREYIDFRNSLGPITLGYCFPAVDDAIRQQLENGIIFGHPHPLECEVAEMLCEIIPCAEQVRFLKTGGEAISACIRLARSVTGREHIIQIGYSGWLNSLASGGRILPGQVAQSAPPGVPLCLSSLHHACNWNDLSAVEQVFSDFPDQIAGVVVAAGYSNMNEGANFYPALRELTQDKQCLLIFDEIVTGFRVAIGGVQEYFGVVPDLAVFGKGVANGMPLSVYAGKKSIMSELQKVIVSSTFGGETLSLAAAKSAILTYKNEDVIGHLWRQGEKMWTGLNDIFQRYSIPAKVQGFYPCPQITFSQNGIREKFFRSAYRNGVSLYDIPYVNYSHKDEDIDEALSRLAKVCTEI